MGMVMKMERIEKRIAILYSLRKQRINDILKKYHLRYEDYQIVMALHYVEETSIEDIEKQTKLDPRLIKYILNHLEGKSFLEIRDQRVYPTQKNNELYYQLKKIIKKSNHEIIQGIDEQEYHEMIEILDKLIEIYE